MLESRKIGWWRENGKTLHLIFLAYLRFWRLAVTVRNHQKYSSAMAILTLARLEAFSPNTRGRQKPVCALKHFSCFSKFFYNNSFSKSFRRIKYKSFISKKININQILLNIEVSSIYIFNYLFLEVNDIFNLKKIK